MRNKSQLAKVVHDVRGELGLCIQPANKPLKEHTFRHDTIIAVKASSSVECQYPGIRRQIRQCWSRHIHPTRPSKIGMARLTATI